MCLTDAHLHHQVDFRGQEDGHLLLEPHIVDYLVHELVDEHDGNHGLPGTCHNTGMLPVLHSKAVWMPGIYHYVLMV